MKSSFALRILTASALLAAAYAGPASAHTKRGALGKPIDAADTYQITCSDDGNGPPARLLVAVRDLAPVKPPLVNVRLQVGSETRESADKKDGDKFYSSVIGLDGGAGPYTVIVNKLNKPGKADKTRKYPEIYQIEYHCMTRSGVHTGTEIVQIPPNQ